MPQRLAEALLDHADDFGKAITDGISAKAPVYHGPASDDDRGGRSAGTLRDSFTYEVEAGTDSLTINVMSSDEPVVWYVIKGWSRGPVTAVNAKALRFYLADGTLMFRRSVGPASKEANDFPTEAIPDIEAAMEPIHEQVLSEAVA